MTNREWLFNKMQNMSDEELYDLIVFDCTDRKKLDKSCGSKHC